MMRRPCAVALSCTSLIFAASPAYSEIRTTPVSGTFNNSQENACIHVSTFYFLTDCFYARQNEQLAGQSLPWTGPTVNPVYYAVNSEHAVPAYVPVPGDDRIAPPMSGTIAIDDRGTPDGMDDTIEAELQVGPAARSVVVNVNELVGGPAGAPPRAVMKWSSIDHVMQATQVDEAMPNDAGGFDYVIASKGFPRLLCRVEDPDDCFPSALAGLTVDGQAAEGTWDGPSPVGLTRDTAMAGNIGASTTAVMHDRACNDNRGDVTCPNHNVVWSASEEPPPGTRNLSEGPGLDNLLLKITTGGDGRVLSLQGFWTNEYRIAAGPPTFQVPEGHNNSWQGGYMQLTAVAPPPVE